MRGGKSSLLFCRREVKIHKTATECQRSKKTRYLFSEFDKGFRYYSDFSPQVLTCLCLSLTLALITQNLYILQAAQIAKYWDKPNRTSFKIYSNIPCSFTVQDVRTHHSCTIMRLPVRRWPVQSSSSRRTYIEREFVITALEQTDHACLAPMKFLQSDLMGWTY